MKHSHAFKPVTRIGTRAGFRRQLPFPRHRRVSPLNPLTVSKLQHAVRQTSFATFKEYTDIVNDESKQLCTHSRPARDPHRVASHSDRGCRTRQGDREALRDRRHVVRLHQQGSARDAGHRDEQHRRTLEHGRRRRRRRAVQGQLAAAPSSRWRARVSASPPTTWSTPTNCRSRVAQGAKPGEGGQLPGHKVDETIARVRHSIPGVQSDLAAAAPRHLLDRGSGAADLRPEER